MPVSVTMPRLGESVTEGTVTRWLKQEGDHVDADEPLLEVSTDKVDTEVPSPASGILLSIKVREDETVEIGVELAVIGDAGELTGSRAGRRQLDAGAGARAATGRRAGGRAAPRRHRQPPRQPSRRHRTRSRDRPARPAPAAAATRASARSGAPRRRHPPPPPAAAASSPRPRRATTTSPAPTSRRWCASWPASTAST